MSDFFEDWMQTATGLMREGRLQEATAAIQQALERGPAPGGLPRVRWPGAPPNAPPSARGFGPAPAAAAKPVDDQVLDGCVFEAPASTAPRVDAAVPAECFLAASHTHGSLTRDYKLYVPPLSGDEPRPLLVMLHGCTQDPDDFAAGTDMNALARAHGWLVLYPAQSAQANPQKCWNWFKHTHQQRGRGEPAWITSLTQSVIAGHAVDPRRVYIAGLSAGGAMAALVAAAYPDVFAAVGVHSGLAPGVAGNLPDALAAMQGNASASNSVLGRARRPGLPGQASPASPASPAALTVPTIVFHGDRDQTVHATNGEQVHAAALKGAAGRETLHASTERKDSPNGRSYTRSIHADASGRSVVERWVVHGAGHAWAGGHGSGSYTDPTGPDASREMLRFFEQQCRPL